MPRRWCGMSGLMVLRKLHAKLYGLVGAGARIGWREKERREALKRGDYEKAGKLREKMQDDRKKRVKWKKEGKGCKQIFALWDQEKEEWKERKELEEFVGRRMERFGKRSQCRRSRRKGPSDSGTSAEFGGRTVMGRIWSSSGDISKE